MGKSDNHLHESWKKTTALRLLGTSKSTTLINFIKAEWKIKPFSLANTFVTYPYISWPICCSETVVLKMNNMEFVRNVSVMLTEGSDHSTFSWSVTLARERAWEWERQTDRQKKSAVGDTAHSTVDYHLTVLIVHQHRCESGGKGRRGELAIL